MTSMTLLIGRNANRFNPIVGRPRDLVGERRRAGRTQDAEAAPTPDRTSDALRFVTAFTGAFVFFSVLIF